MFKKFFLLLFPLSFLVIPFCGIRACSEDLRSDRDGSYEQRIGEQGSIDRRSLETGEKMITVLVSVPPYVSLVQEIGGDKVRVLSLVPEGRDPHSFEPSIQEAGLLAGADVWFSIDDPHEIRMERFLTGSGVRRISLSPSDSSQDRHYWLSLPLVVEQMQKVVDELGEMYPEHKAFWKNRADVVRARLNELHRTLLLRLSDSPRKVIVATHAAFGYFCESYGLEQIGLDACQSVHSHEWAVKRAQELSVDQVWLVPQHSEQGGRYLARQLGAVTVVVDPYNPNLEDNLRTMAQHLVSCHKDKGSR